MNPHQHHPGPMAQAPMAGLTPGAATALGQQGPAAQQAPYWLHRAQQRTSFLTQVRVEFRKLAGTRSDRILLVVGPMVLITLSTLAVFALDRLDSAGTQIQIAVESVRVTAIVLHAALIKLIAGEWQHRSAQPTMLVQPSRARYFLAQAAVVFALWLFCAAAQIAITFIVTPIAAEPGSGYLLGYRPGWVIGVIVLGSLMAIMTALIVSMLLPNAAGALAVYVGVIPLMMIVAGLAPKVFIWLDPLATAITVAGLSPVENPGPAFTSLALWLGLFVLSGWLVSRRDLA